MFFPAVSGGVRGLGKAGLGRYKGGRPRCWWLSSSGDGLLRRWALLTLCPEMSCLSSLKVGTGVGSGSVVCPVSRYWYKVMDDCGRAVLCVQLRYYCGRCGARVDILLWCVISSCVLVRQYCLCYPLSKIKDIIRDASRSSSGYVVSPYQLYHIGLEIVSGQERYWCLPHKRDRQTETNVSISSLHFAWHSLWKHLPCGSNSPDLK